MIESCAPAKSSSPRPRSSAFSFSFLLTHYHAHLRLQMRCLRAHVGRVPIDQGRAHKEVPQLRQEEGQATDRGRGRTDLSWIRVLPDGLSQRLVQEICRSRQTIAVRWKRFCKVVRFEIIRFQIEQQFHDQYEEFRFIREKIRLSQRRWPSVASKNRYAEA
jgi:hypothetical protein